MFNFAAFPPEINSALMYAGAGVGPMLGAAAAWDSLAEDLTSTVAEYSSAIGTLDGTWSGPSATAMTSSATRYLQWMTTTAQMAAQTAAQATAAAAAYEEAFTATVPPPVIVANRTLLSALVATNFLGINTAAIMATEAQYMQMWAQDVTAMFGYQAQTSAATATLPQWTPPAPTTTGVQAAAVLSPAGNAQGVLGDIFAPGSNQLTTGLPGLLNQISGQSGSAFGSLLNSTLGNDFASSGILNPGETLAPMVALAAIAPAFQQSSSNKQQTDIAAQTLRAQELANELQALQSGYPPGAFNGTGQSISGYGGMGSASIGNASSVGGLSVPNGWASVANNTNAINTVGAPAGRPLMGGMPLGMMPLTTSRGAPGPREKVKGERIKSVVPHHPSGG